MFCSEAVQAQRRLSLPASTSQLLKAIKEQTKEGRNESASGHGFWRGESGVVSLFSPAIPSLWVAAPVYNEQLRREKESRALFKGAIGEIKKRSKLDFDAY